MKVDLTVSEKMCVRALKEILIAQVVIYQETGRYWKLDISGLHRLMHGGRAIEKVGADIASADARPSSDPHLSAHLSGKPVALHGYLLRTLMDSDDSGNMAHGQPVKRTPECRFDFVLTKGGTLFFSDKPSEKFPQTDEQFLNSGWSEIELDE